MCEHELTSPNAMRLTESQVAETNARVAETNKRVAELTTVVTQLCNTVVEMKGEIQEIKGDVQGVKVEVQDVKGNQGKLSSWQTIVHLVFIGFVAVILGGLTHQLFDSLFP